MKIKIQDKVIDLDIVEHMTYHRDMLIIDYNNGRTLSFGAKSPEEVILKQGDSKEVQTFVHTKKQLLGLSEQQVKEKYALKSIEDKVYGIVDMEKFNEDYTNSKAKFSEVVEKILEHWNEYQHDHVMIL